jgi:pimeloyl-ACP methyl ester carboxylesterase
MQEYPEQLSRLAFWAACLECRLQRPEDALDRLRVLITGGGWVNPDRLRHDEDLALLRARQEWVGLIAVCEQRRADEQARIQPRLQALPPGSPVGSLPPLVVALHMRSGNIDETRANWLSVTELGFTLAMPQGTELVGPGEFGWTDETVGQVGQQLAELRETHSFDAGRVVFAGASQGAARAVEMAVSGQPLPSKGFIAIVGAPELESLQPWIGRARNAGVRGVFITGERDSALARVRAAHRLLERSGLDVRLEVVPGLGHQYPAELSGLLPRALKFLLGQR